MPVPTVDPADPSGQSITVTNATQPPAPKTFTEEDLERVRQQEKAKLYGEIEKLSQRVSQFDSVQAELEALRKEREEREARESAAREQADQQAKASREAEMTAKELLEERQREWQAELDEIRQEAQLKDAALQKEREFAQLRDYIQQRVAQEKDSIAPELLDLVTGNSPEEVDSSIETLKAKSIAIAESVRAKQQQLAAQQQGVSPAGFATTGPMDMLPGTKNYSVEEIKAMSPREYAEKIRGRFLGGSDSRNRGLFG
jgi:hypothetical protein